MATPAAPPLLPAAPQVHHPPPSSGSPATVSPPPAAASAASSPAPPAAHPLLLHRFRGDFLLPNGGAPRSGGAPPGSGAKPVYATPSPVESTPQNNECRLVEVKGARLASFTVRDRELICLPQAFDVFLKHLVGGLHTVYTKLKRLDITPVVCNVEQVRVLRGLGAIAPGVNRCKLISRQDFETLYSDCTSASSRPGRPPKRLQTEGATHHVLARGGLLHAGIMPPADLSILAKKIKLETLAGYSSSHPQARPTGEDGEHSPGLVLDQLPFMMMSHPLIPAGLAPASVSMAMGQMNRLSTLASMAKAAHLHAKPLSRAPTSVIRERVLDSPSPTPSLEDAHVSSNHSSSVSSSPSHVGPTAGPTPTLDNGALRLSPAVGPESSPADVCKENQKNHRDTHGSREGCDRQAFHRPPSGRQGCERRSQRLPAGLQQAPFIFPEGLSSMETLLTNIQGLLRVAIENARAQEKQDQLERTELKMELVRERELRETLERQLSVEQKNRVLIQKRLKKEKRNKRRLQEALEEEVKLRDQAEHTLLHTASTHTAALHTEAGTPEEDVSDPDGASVDARAPAPGPEPQACSLQGRVFLQAAGMY